MENKDNGKKGSRLFRPIRFLFRLSVYLFVFLLVITTITAFILKNERIQAYVKKRVQATVEEKMHLRIDFSDFSLSLLPISFNLNDVEISPVTKELFTSGIQVKQVKLSTGIHPIVAIKFALGYSQEEIQIKNIQLIGIDANLYLKDGKIALPEISLKNEDEPEEIKEDAEKGKGLIVKEVEIKDSNISFEDLDSGDELSVTGIHTSFGTENIKEKITFFSKVAAVNIKKGSLDEKVRDIMFDGEYSFKKESIRLKKARLFKGEESVAELSGDLFLKPKLSYAVVIDLNVFDSEIKKFLPKKFKFDGEYKFSGKLTGTEKKFDLSGQAASKKGNIYGIIFDALSLDVQVDNDGITVKNLKGKIFGGDVTGSYNMPFATAPDFTARLSLSHVTINDIQKSCPAVPGLLGGELNGTLEGEGRFKGGYFINVRADLRSPRFVLYKDLYAPAKKNEDRLVFNNMKLATSLDVSKRGLYFKDLTLTTDDFDIDVTGSMPKYRNFNLDFQGDINNLGVIKTPAGLKKELIGAAIVKGSLRDRAADPEISIKLTAFNVLYDNLLIDRAQGSASYKDKRVALQNISAQKDGYDLTVNGDIDMKEDLALSLDIDINNADIADLNGTLLELGKNRVAALDNFSGGYKGSVKVRGSANKPEISFSVVSDGMAVYKNELEFHVKGDATKESMTIKEAAITRDDIRLTLDGDINFKEGLDLEYKTNYIYLKDIFRILNKDDTGLNAKFSASGKIFGGFDNIRLTSKGYLSGASFKGHKLKNSDFELTYDKAGVNITGDFFSSEVKFGLKLSGDKFDRIVLKSSFDGFEPDPVLAAVFNGENIKCIVDGTLDFDAKLDYENLTSLDHYLSNTKMLEANMKISDFSTAKYKLDESLVFFSYEDNEGDLKMRVLKNKIEFMSHFKYDGDIQTANNLYIEDLKVSDIKNYIKESEGIEGTVDIDLNFKLNNLLSTKKVNEYISNLRDINGSININNIIFNAYKVGEFCLNLKTKDDILKLKGFCHNSLFDIDGVVNYSGEKDYSIKIATSKAIDYPEFIKQFKIRLPEEIKGEATFDLLITGKVDDFKQFSMRIGSDLFTAETSELEFKNDGKLSVLFSNDTFSVESFTLKEENSSFSLSGSVDSKKMADLKIDGDLNLLLVKPFLPKKIERLEGLSAVTVKLKGELSDPEISGSFELREGLLGVAGFPENFEDITGKGIFSEKLITVEGITGKLNKTPVVITGDIIMGKDEPVTLNLSIDYEMLNLTYLEYIETDTTSSLKLEGPVNDLTLSGTVDLVKLEYTKQIETFTTKDFVNFFKRFKKRKTKPLRVEKGKVGLKFDIAINAEEGSIKIDNNLVKCELKGNLNLIGDASNAVVLGNLEITSGKILVLWEDFEFTSGIINFSNESYIKPEFDIIAEREVPCIGSDDSFPVTVNFSGDTEDPVVTQTAPGLEQTEVVELYTSGICPEETEAEKARKREAAAFRFFSGKISSEISKQFGPSVFDRFVIVPYYSESSQGTSAQLVVGKDLDTIVEGLSVEYSTDISGTDEQNAELEYQINNNMSIVGDWDNQGTSSRGSFGGDLRFRFEFR
jgi:autotransporter translocation and assembly factor TamB